MSDEIKVIKGMPMPPAGRGRGAVSIYAALEVGDCFQGDNRQAIAASSYARRQTPRWKFAQRTIDGVTYIWRVE